DGRRRAEIERPKGRVHHMANPVSNGPGSERHPPPPIPRHPEGRVSPKSRRTEPKVIIETGRNLMVLAQFGQVPYLRIHFRKRVCAGVNRMHLPNGACPNPFTNA